MQALIVAISLLLFSTINSSEIQIENATTLEENHMVQLKEVQSYVCVQTLKDSDFYLSR